jgi:hypothetical protein
MLGEMEGTWTFGVDLDSCRTPPTGEIEVWAQQVIDRFGSYAEVSPSGTGVKIFSQAEPADIAALRKITGHNSWSILEKRQTARIIPPPSNCTFLIGTTPSLGIGSLALRLTFAESHLMIAGKPNPNPKTTEHQDPPRQEKTATTDDILARLNTAAKHNKGIDTAL